MSVTSRLTVPALHNTFIGAKTRSPRLPAPDSFPGQVLGVDWRTKVALQEIIDFLDVYGTFLDVYGIVLDVYGIFLDVLESITARLYDRSYVKTCSVVLKRAW